jgi:hypothetical protein
LAEAEPKKCRFGRDPRAEAPPEMTVEGGSKGESLSNRMADAAFADPA